MSASTDRPEFTGAILLFIFLCVVAGLTEAFWNPYQDDAEDMDYLARFRE